MSIAKSLGALLALVPLLGVPALAEQITDAAGRQVDLDLPAKRVLVGEARQVSVISALVGKRAFDRIVGWRDDLITKDHDTYNSYLEVFPAIADLPRFGYVGNGTFDLESAIALKPDVFTLNLESLTAAKESRLEETLAAAGIKLVYIDFRVDPDANTENSIAVLGKLFGGEKRAEELIDYRRAQFARVAERLAAHPELRRPKVYIERAPGITGDAVCCRTFGPVNFGKMIALGGGHNIGSDFFDTFSGDLNPEQLVVSDPDIVVVTGANWSGQSDVNRFVSIGPGADLAQARKKLSAMMESLPFSSLPAVARGDVHAVWHQFYGTPYDFVAVQQFAKWFHPEVFADLDPDATFRDLHERFLPIPFKPGYFVSLNKENN
ncbi:ABC transporter substrate-binding protein [Ciceribacter ferrooxidans]|uniref:ABC transporter substrate-binding protein n=1 Tax=Ciceribacter ferrooxidans TaxID=2509717 RepID=A0A4Q2T5C9_9HYPH|nr:ABC transporter substrate-binding protein [Ciceribacter ferrooxidans]RYC13996.1 ABC transporter substrate-binding protein [Ciceribacter ferrooxidans]